MKINNIILVLRTRIILLSSFVIYFFCICHSGRFPIVLPSKVPAFLNVVDIAGLVKGAHEGQGLGNAFLSHIRACDALFHMSSK